MKNKTKPKKESPQEFLGRISREYLEDMQTQAAETQRLENALQVQQKKQIHQKQMYQLILRSERYFEGVIVCALEEFSEKKICLFSKRWNSNQFNEKYELALPMDFVTSRGTLVPDPEAFFRFLSNSFYSKEILKKYAVKISFGPKETGKIYEVQNGSNRGDVLEVTPYSQSIFLERVSG